jgi:hypothetical protein
MKKLLLFCLGLVMLSQRAFAPWAAHLVISPASLLPPPKDSPEARFHAKAAAFARGVTAFALPKGFVTVAIEAEADEGKMGRDYYLIVSKKRLAGDALDLREALGSVNENVPQDWRDRFSKDFEVVRPLQRMQWKGKTVVAFILEREKALRSYVVWDYKMIYQDGGMLLDGGFWLTYDVPAFVEASEKPERPKDK